MTAKSDPFGQVGYADFCTFLRRAAWVLRQEQTDRATALLRAATALDKLKWEADYRISPRSL